MGTLQRAMVQAVAGDGLAALGLDYERLPDGRFYVAGTRPGPGWHVHGDFPSSMGGLWRGIQTRLPILKRRWFDYHGDGSTCSSQAPDDLGLRYSALIVALELFAWLDAAVGLHAYTSLFPVLEDRPSRRTVQRWLARLRPHALAAQHAVRAVLLARLEPRPLEVLFPAGLSPPTSIAERWRGPQGVEQLHRALAMLLGGAIALDCPVASLLAEACKEGRPAPADNG